ncbi:MAG: hypothetical protein M3O87_03270, partial [Candidatus Dormibacteraeota bacterium]|nr:hypothetical protein [Candidatus Dormibacteraeota bacterium]
LQQAAGTGSVVGWYAGHTHRNKRTLSAFASNVPFIELGAVKEYPGGFGLVRVFEGGYAVNFYKTKGDAARTWSERSRGEYLNLYPYYTLGSLDDRNFVIHADFSDAARAIFGNGSGSSPGIRTPGPVSATEPPLPATSTDVPAAAAGPAVAALGAVSVAGAVAGALRKKSGSAG